MRDSVYNSLKTCGIFEMECFLDDSEIALIAKEIELKQLQSSSNSGYCDIRHNGNNVLSSNVYKLQKIKDIVRMMHDISEDDNPGGVSDDDKLIVTRSLLGRNGNKESHSFHYDSFYLTALIGIKTPSNESASGGLISAFKLRKKETGPLANILQKIAIQNRVSKKIISFLVKKRIIRTRTISLTPGKLLIFYGARTLHASDFFPDGNRITLLVHVGLPNVKYKNMNVSELKLKIKRVFKFYNHQ